MTKCIYREVTLNHNKPEDSDTATLEHIIPWAIGGSNGFATGDASKGANNDLGSEVDAKFADTLRTRTVERHEVIDLMRELKLVGMKAAYDEVLSNALKRQHAAQDIVGSLLQAEIAEKQARSIRYQVAAAKLPLIKEIAEFDLRIPTMPPGYSNPHPRIVLI